jgi:hypothetical protein
MFVRQPTRNATDDTLNVDPSSPGYSGRKHFFTDQSSVIRMNMPTAASSSDPAI